MTWAVIFGLIMQIIGPWLIGLIKKLFDKWFAKAESQLSGIDPTVLPPHIAVGKLFEELETVLPKTAPIRKLLLRVVKRISVARADQILTGDIKKVTPLTSDEIEELKLACEGVKKEK
jgi:hypothetical protein